VQHVLPSIVPRARTPLLKRAPSWPRGPGTSFNCLSSFLGAASLAACSQSTVVQNSRFVSPSRQASFAPRSIGIHSSPTGRVSSVRKAYARFARHHHATPTQVRLAGELPASTRRTNRPRAAEKFDTHDLTAAHRTLPFWVTRFASDKTSRTGAIRDSGGSMTAVRTFPDEWSMSQVTAANELGDR